MRFFLFLFLFLFIFLISVKTTGQTVVFTNEEWNSHVKELKSRKDSLHSVIVNLLQQKKEYEDSLGRIEDNMVLRRGQLTKQKDSLNYFTKRVAINSNYRIDSLKHKNDSLYSVIKYLSYNTKYAELSLIKYANNKLYYPYDASIEDALSYLNGIKDNPYPQLNQILEQYHLYTEEILELMEKAQASGLSHVSSNNEFNTSEVKRLRDSYANEWLPKIRQTSYYKNLYKKSNSIHYLDVIIDKVYIDRIRKYQSGQLNIVSFQDVIEFPKIFRLK